MEGFIDLPVKSLIKADWNYKENDSDKLEKLKRNIQKNGLIENIIVRELPKNKYEIVNGNHRFDVLSQLEIENVHCFNLGKITLNQAKRIAIETNESKFNADLSLLGANIKDILQDFPVEDLSSTFFMEESEIIDYSEMSEFSFDEYEDGLKEKKEIEEAEEILHKSFSLRLGVYNRVLSEMEKNKVKDPSDFISSLLDLISEAKKEK
jgi:hypothetical protein